MSVNLPSLCRNPTELPFGIDVGTHYRNRSIGVEIGADGVGALGVIKCGQLFAVEKITVKDLAPVFVLPDRHARIVDPGRSGLYRSRHVGCSELEG
jgi:hypothetical protein